MRAAFVIAAKSGRLRALSGPQAEGSTLKRIQRPFFGNVGLSCAYCKKQALRRGSVGTDSLLKLPR
jgi:hypothetical protein